MVGPARQGLFGEAGARPDVHAALRRALGHRPVLALRTRIVREAATDVVVGRRQGAGARVRQASDRADVDAALRAALGGRPVLALGA